MRYAQNAVAWGIHDIVVHPVTGLLGMVGRARCSLRLMALAHHIHNATAPNNDVLADYADAAKRAGCNETKNNPHGSMTPDEQEWRREQVRRITGKEGWISDKECEEVLDKHGIEAWNSQACGGDEPELLSKEEAVSGQRERAARLHLKQCEERLRRFDDFKLGGYVTRNLREELRGELQPNSPREIVIVDGARCVGIDGLRRERMRRQNAVDRAHEALEKEIAGVSVADILGVVPTEAGR